MHVKGQVRRIVTSLIPVSLLVSILAAQNYQMRTKVDLVVVHTTVRDGKGKLVPGLTQKDFTIFEDRVPQMISNFSDDPQPLSAAIVIDTGMGGISMRRLVPLFIALTSGFSDFDELAAFRFDHFVFPFSYFTIAYEKFVKSLVIVKRIE